MQRNQGLLILGEPGAGKTVTLLSLASELILNRIILVETMSRNWNQFWKKTIFYSIVGLILALIYGRIHGLIDKPSAWLTIGWLKFSETTGVSLILALLFALAAGLAGGFTHRVKVGKAFPNQGSNCRGEIHWLHSSFPR